MKRCLFALGLLAAVAGCGDQGKSSSGGQSSVSKGFSIDRAQCSAGAIDVGEVIRPIRTVELRVAASPGAPKVVNEKATKIMGKTHYHKIDASERIFYHCRLGSASYVTMVEPEWLKGVSGWVDTDDLVVKKNSGDPYEGKISEWVLEDYSDSSLIDGSEPSDPTYKRFSAKTKEINDLKVAAAKKAIDTDKCDHVSSVLFLRRESTLSNFKFMIDCEEGKRIEVYSSDLSSSAPLKTNDEKAVTRSEAITQCKILIVERLVNKSSVRFSEIFGSSYYKAPTTGNVRLNLDFEASNKLGQSIKHQAVCIISPDGEGEVTIYEK